jgi:hypothetical protein
MSDPDQAPGEAPKAPDDRSTTFRAVQGEPEHYSGEALLVSAYAILWLILLSWVALVWRKQNAIVARLADLEREIDKADRAAASAGSARAVSPPQGTPRP